MWLLPAPRPFRTAAAVAIRSPGLAAGAPCAEHFRPTPTSLNHEYLYNVRVDHQFSDKDRGYIRVGRDNGFQPTYTSPLAPRSTTSSNQPQMSAQVNEAHTFNPTTVNTAQRLGSVLRSDLRSVGSHWRAGRSAYVPELYRWRVPEISAPMAHRAASSFRKAGECSSISSSTIFRKSGDGTSFRLGYSWLHQTVSDLDFEGLAARSTAR